MNEVKVRMLKMEPIKVRCKSCSKEIRAAAGKSVCCGCANMTTIKGDVISAVTAEDDVDWGAKAGVKFTF